MRSWLFLLLSLGVSTPLCGACQCDSPPSACPWSGAADAIFSGKAIAQNPGATSFEILKSFGGSDAQTVTISTGAASDGCGYRFELGRNYLVYAHRVHGMFATDKCSGTKPLEQAADDLLYLRTADPIANRNSPKPTYLYGRVSSREQDLQQFSALAEPVLPVAGAIVIARGTSDGSEERTITDDGGRYRFYGLPEGNYEVEVRAVGSYNTHRFDMHAGECTYRPFLNSARAALVGQVVIPGSEQIATYVALVPVGKTFESSETNGLRTEAAEDGSFQLFAPAGRYYLGARLRGRRETYYFPGVLGLEHATVLELPPSATDTAVKFRVPRPATTLPAKSP